MRDYEYAHRLYYPASVARGLLTPTSNLINGDLHRSLCSDFHPDIRLSFKSRAKNGRELTGEPIESEKQEIIDKAEELRLPPEAEEALGDAGMEVTRATIASGASGLGQQLAWFLPRKKNKRRRIRFRRLMNKKEEMRNETLVCSPADPCLFLGISACKRAEARFASYVPPKTAAVNEDIR